MIAIAAAPPPQPPSKKEDESLWALVLVALPVLNLLFLTVLALTFWRRRIFWLRELHHMVDQIKAELPGVIVGEILTRWDVARMDKRIQDLEATVGWLEDRCNGDESNKPAG